MKIVVYGHPAPQGSKRFMGVHGGKGVMKESSAKVKPWREDVKAAAEAAIALRNLAPWEPMNEPVAMVVVFTLPAPQSLPKRRASYPSKLPDLSKLVRSTEDALTSAGIWKDDARVVDCRSIKTYPVGTPGAHPDALHSPGAVIRVFPYPG